MFRSTSLLLLLSFSPLLGPCEGEPTDVPPPTPDSACVVTGCSGQICASEPMASTCEWTCEYGCYQLAVCEVQSAGMCGWTPTAEFEQCVRDCAGSPM